MNALAIYVVNEHIQSLMEEAAARATANGLATGPSLRDRIASAAAGLRRLVASSIESAAVLPPLKDYPYRR